MSWIIIDIIQKVETAITNVVYITTLVWRTIYSKEMQESFQLGWKHDLQFAQWGNFLSSRRRKGNIYYKLNGNLKINKPWRVLQSILSLYLKSLSPSIFPSLCRCRTEDRLCLVKGTVCAWCSRLSGFFYCLQCYRV